MADTKNRVLYAAMARILRPLIHILIRNGISYGTFADLAKWLFVDVAKREFAIEGRKQTVSRVSVVTGLNRKEVKRMLELDDDQPDISNRQYNRSIRVLGGWINDPEFQRRDGLPKDLTYDGESSFTTLVRKYSGDMPVAAMQKALTKSGNICTTGDNQIRLLSHAYLPSDDPVEHINILGIDARQLIETINHNITADGQDLRFQRKASNHQVSIEAIPAVKRFLSRKGQSFLEEIDHYLTEHESDEHDDTAELSISLFYHESVPHKKDETS